jgi:hypothetical protein
VSPRPNNASSEPDEPDLDPLSNTRREVIITNGDPVASPLGWIPDGGLTTAGNNVRAYPDLDDLNQASGYPLSMDRVFHFPLDLTTSWTTMAFKNASAVNIFYLCNRAHDYFYALGFDEAAGNYQVDNFGHGGAGNDPVIAETLNGGDYNNAYFTPAQDGNPGRLEVMVFTYSTPRRDSAYDAHVVYHEYTHGVSTRLVGGPDEVYGLDGIQSGGMGEGWSDFFALSITASPDRDWHLPVPLAAYAENDYINGIRRYPYTRDMEKNPLTYQVIRNNTKVHAVGEIWASALWDAWLALADCYGFEDGRERMERIVLEGLALTAPAPTFLDARDAILLADELLYNGQHQRILWKAFARRGIGLNAWDGGHEDAINVTESFDLPTVWEGAAELEWKSPAFRPDTMPRFAELILRDGDIAGAGSATVQVTDPGSGDTETVALNEVGCWSGIFAGGIPIVLGPVVEGDLQLQTEVSGQVVAYYADADHYGAPAQVSAFIQLDSEPPVFEGVASLKPGILGVEVRWNPAEDISTPIEYSVFAWPEGSARPEEPAARLLDEDWCWLGELSPQMYHVAVLARDAAGNQDTNDRVLSARPFAHGAADHVLVRGLADAFAVGEVGFLEIEAVDASGNRVTDGVQPQVKVSLNGPGLLVDFRNPQVVERSGPQQWILALDQGIAQVAVTGYGHGWVDVHTELLNDRLQASEPAAPDQFVRVPSSWVDLETAAGQSTGIIEDDQIASAIPLGFTFYYDGTGFSSITVSANGYASFGTTYFYGDHHPIPDGRRPNGYLGPFASDLLPRSGDSRILTKTLGETPNRVFIVQWTRMGHFDDPDASLTFQLLLYETGEIEFQYADMTNDAYNFGDGSDATVGIENLDGTDGVQFAYNQAGIIQPWSGLRLVAAGSLPMLISGDRTPESDLDGDQLSDQVETLIGSSPEREDTDGDDFTDWQEVYMCGTDPANHADRFQMNVLWDSSGYWLTWPSRVGRFYTIEGRLLHSDSTWLVLPGAERLAGAYPDGKFRLDLGPENGVAFRVKVDD